MNKYKFFALIALITVNIIAKAAIIVNYSPQSLALGDNLELTLILDDATKTGSPNLMPLLKDFEILSTQRSYSFADINGKTKSEAQWTIVLKPKHGGEITIPSISVGNEQTQPFTINVENNAVKTNKNFHHNSTYTILKVAVNEPSPFLNQQIIYTVKLYNRQQLFNGQYKAPEVENALVVPLGDGKSYQTTYKNSIYNVEELSYAIFPQKIGNLTITPPEFNAEVIDGFSPTNIHLTAKTLTINVKPLPNGQDIGNWLAAENVSLSEDYENIPKTYTAGDTIVRNITLKATGMVGQLLPKLTFKSTKSYSVYANKPHIENNLVDGKIIATANYKVTYLLAKATTTKIPAISIPWYNIDTKANLVASLPAKTINIGANITKKTPVVAQEIKTVSIPQKTPSKSFWIIFAIILVLFCSVIVCKHLISRRPKTQTNPKLNDIQRTCKAHNPALARQALLTFARQEWPDLKILNLNNIPIEDVNFKQEITKLTATLYAKHENMAWDGTKLWEIISKLKIKKIKKKHKKSANKSLPPIYLN